MAVVMAATAATRPPTVDLRPLAAMAATSERPARVGVGSSQHMAMGWLGERVAEFEVSGRPRTLRRREEVVVHGTPTGESNPAATSKSWWQGPPQGGSDRTVSTPPVATAAIVMEGRPYGERWSHAALAGPSDH